ncbi:DUF72 domain-containing protein [candidate division KSB1 bacterium]|nr:DUF72 domain-containing protein [candidate division KSB1 bacterium]
MQTQSQILVGPAGWHYKDWYGPFYPEKAGKDFKELDYLANYFDTVEINSTFYRPANGFMGSAWVRKVAHNPNFKFTAKLWQRFTHERQPFGKDEVETYRQGIDPLMEAGKLGAVLCQFPWSFKNNEGNRHWLSSIFENFKDYPLVIEIRHASWDNPAFYEVLEKRQVGIACIDQPVIGQSIAFKPVRTGPIGYVRMHGRNYKSWFPPKNQEKVDGSARYDYLYDDDEIEEITGNVQQIADKARETYVVQNNHPRGQAITNAMQIRAALGEAIESLPPELLASFPQLKKILTN